MINLIGRSIGFNWKKHRPVCKVGKTQEQAALVVRIASDDVCMKIRWKGFKMCGNIKLLLGNKIVSNARSGFPAMRPLSTKL